MRRAGLWHPRLLAVIAAMGHTDTLVVADPGLPVPPGVETIDLVWRRGEPPFLPVLEEVLGDLVVESAAIATEAADPALLAGLRRLLGDRLGPTISHEELKRACVTATAVVRTGEATPYANVVLVAGVPF